MSQGVNASEIAQMEAPAESVNPRAWSAGELRRGPHRPASVLDRRLVLRLPDRHRPSAFPSISPSSRPLSLTSSLGVAMVAWAAWLIGLAVRRRSIVDGAMAWLAVAGRLRARPLVRRQHAEPGGARHPCRLSLPRRRRMIANHRAGTSSMRAVWLGRRHRRLPGRALPMGSLQRADRSRGRADARSTSSSASRRSPS